MIWEEAVALSAPPSISREPFGAMPDGTASAPLNDGRIVVAGGHSSDGTLVSQVGIYDPALQSWQDGGQLATARTGHTASALPDGRDGDDSPPRPPQAAHRASAASAVLPPGAMRAIPQTLDTTAAGWDKELIHFQPVRRWIAIAAAVAGLGAAGCVRVKPYEREQLSRRAMADDRAPGERRFEQHARGSREGSDGGTGEAGGGCGCN